MLPKSSTHPEHRRRSNGGCMPQHMRKGLQLPPSCRCTHTAIRPKQAQETTAQLQSNQVSQAQPVLVKLTASRQQAEGTEKNGTCSVTSRGTRIGTARLAANRATAQGCRPPKAPSSSGAVSAFTPPAAPQGQQAARHTSHHPRAPPRHPAPSAEMRFQKASKGTRRARAALAGTRNCAPASQAR